MRRTPSASRWIHATHGFALLITLTLLALLVVVAVAFATLTRIELHVAANQQSITQAQQHALMALNIAIGQLQKYAGPDARISAQASATNVAATNPWYTGIWNANEANVSPLIWLVSGNETNPLSIGPETDLARTTSTQDRPLLFGSNGVAINGPEHPEPNTVRLVGTGTAGTGADTLNDGSVIVPGVPINLTPPGMTETQTVGRYAYWIGDQGVKASLGLTDRSAAVNYAPWLKSEADDQRSRIRQQVTTATGYFRDLASEHYGFDPLDERNEAVSSRLLDINQCQFLTPVAANAPLADFVREHYHAFTLRAVSVLANTLPDDHSHRGLLHDLSMQPALLGNAFAAYANYPAYMESPSTDNTAVPPITTTASSRRRYYVSPTVATAATDDAPAIEFGVAPVLASFLLQFRVMRAGRSLRVRSRLFTELWNPYTAALVPPSGLTLEITGLPRIQITDTGAGGGSLTFDLQAVDTPVRGSGNSPQPMQVNLPFTIGKQTDRASWLPGRIYAWVTESGSKPSADLNFYAKNISAQGWAYPSQPLSGRSNALAVTCSEETILKINLKSGEDVLASYTSPSYEPLSVPNVESPGSSGNWVFAYGFRLRQPSSLNKDRDWLLIAGNDVRNVAPPATLFTAFNETLDIAPEVYVGTPATSTGVNNFLLYRAAGIALSSTRSANNDAPLFELPRLPQLSLGALQHLRFSAGRPFALGNSWGSTVLDLSGGTVNGWFDRFFFSGITASDPAPDILSGVPLPSGSLFPIDGRADRSIPFSIDVLRDEGGACTSRFLVQTGGFNVNSTNPAAWRAVLTGMRFSTAKPFQRLEVDEDPDLTAYTGSQACSPQAVVAVANEIMPDATLADAHELGGPTFFRFPQSAQETYAWSTSPIDGLLSKQTFRQGVRGGNPPSDTPASGNPQELSTHQIETMAHAIVSLIRLKIAESGPFVSMEAFLAPHKFYGDVSLFEKAIAEAGINATALTAPIVPEFTNPGFSSLTLTAADIMTALAPYLRTRSDTFIVRSYGEVINPATSMVTGRAWCEATVQRFPETLDAEDNVTKPSITGFGRRFKITQFRWLSHSDI